MSGVEINVHLTFYSNLIGMRITKCTFVRRTIHLRLLQMIPRMLFITFNKNLLHFNFLLFSFFF